MKAGEGRKKKSWHVGLSDEASPPGGEKGGEEYPPPWGVYSSSRMIGGGGEGVGKQMRISLSLLLGKEKGKGRTLFPSIDAHSHRPEGPEGNLR